MVFRTGKLDGWYGMDIAVTFWCEGVSLIAGYWDVLQLLGQERQLPAFKALQSMLPRLADQGQLLVLACALTQVCLLHLFVQQLRCCQELSFLPT